VGSGVTGGQRTGIGPTRSLLLVPRAAQNSPRSTPGPTCTPSGNSPTNTDLDRRLPTPPRRRATGARKDEAGGVVQLQLALDKPAFDRDGNVLLTPAVATTDALDSAVNALQAELDQMRTQGQRLLPST
jgi:hypothetical protein